MGSNGMCNDTKRIRALQIYDKKNKPYFLSLDFSTTYVESKTGHLEPGKYRLSKYVVNRNIPEGGYIEAMAYKFSVEFEIEEFETEDTSEEIKYGN